MKEETGEGTGEVTGDRLQGTDPEVRDVYIDHLKGLISEIETGAALLEDFQIAAHLCEKHDRPTPTGEATYLIRIRTHFQAQQLIKDLTAPVSFLELQKVMEQWREEAAHYFQLAETEKDPLGVKFYQSYALALANCLNDVARLMDPAGEPYTIPELRGSASLGGEVKVRRSL